MARPTDPRSGAQAPAVPADGSVTGPAAIGHGPVGADTPSAHAAADQAAGEAAAETLKAAGEAAAETLKPAAETPKPAGEAAAETPKAAGGNTEPGAVRRIGAAGHHVARAALLIAVLTVASRLVGFARTLVLGHAVPTDLNKAYVTANTIPNIIFEIVAGGALASLVVPLVSGPIAARDRADVNRTASALLTWVLSILVPLAVLVAVLARPIAELAIPSGGAAGNEAIIDSATTMLRVFAPQIPLYGIGIVLGGLLQAHRRFAWPVLAPLLSSAVVIATYATYRAAYFPDVSGSAQFLLAGGTTVGVVVLSLCMVVPVRRLGIRVRPAYRFAGSARHTVAPLAAVAVVTVAAQQLSLFIAVRLVNAPGAGNSSAYAYTLAMAVYLVPWSVLALPVATSVYPSLATAAATGDDDGYARTLARTTRSVLILSAAGAGLLIATARPLARVFAAIASATSPDAHTLALALGTFAPGLIGYGLFALHSRALYAAGLNRFAMIATVAGWGTVIAASYALAAVFPIGDRVVAVTTANSVGMIVLAVVLVVIIGRRAGTAALDGLVRATVAALAAGAAAALAGLGVQAPLPGRIGVVGDIGAGLLAAVVALAAFGIVAAALDRHDVRPLASRLGRSVGRFRRASRG